MSAESFPPPRLEESTAGMDPWDVITWLVVHYSPKVCTLSNALHLIEFYISAHENTLAQVSYKKGFPH